MIPVDFPMWIFRRKGRGFLDTVILDQFIPGVSKNWGSTPDNGNFDEHTWRVGAATPNAGFSAQNWTKNHQT